MRIVFFGTPDFAAHSLKSIVQAGFEVVGVVTAPDRPAGRGQKMQASAVKQAALDLGLPLSQPEKLKSPEFQEQLREWHPDLGVVIAFRMLPEMVWSFPAMGTVNLHASLLPDYRGAAPIQHAIINGETMTGLSTFRLVHEIDTGDVLLQDQVAIEDDETGGSLHDKLMIKGAQTMVDTLQCLKDQTCKARPQGGSSIKIAPKLNRDFCRLNPESESAIQCERKIRALSPYPGAWVNSSWGDVKIWGSQKPEECPEGSQSGLSIEGKELYLNCLNGRLRIESLQLPGKGRINARDFINGVKAG
jgi:methionyl-tRNA formyltransferase